MVKGIIFDLDGTLLDSMWVWERVAEKFLESRGVKPPKDINERMFTMSTTESANMFREEFNINESIEDIKKGVVEIIADSYLKAVELKPFVKEFLQSKKSEGIRLCALTASELVYIIPTLKRLGIYDCFEFVTSCSELGMNKSSYEIFDVVAKKLGVPKAEVTIFEDSYHALESAKRGGYTTVGIYDSMSEGHIAEAKKYSDSFIYSFEELI